jgi:leucyl aminopeptidase (aminopeptidase T)
MDETDRIHVQTELGTDLSMEVRSRKGRGRRGGIYSEKGAWGNLPCGEAFIAPLEGTSRGVYVVDVAHAGVGRLSQPLIIQVQEGRAVDLQGGEAALLLTKVLSNLGDPRAFNIAELGIGCHDRAAVDSITLEAEKAQGTCHIALGSNCHFGGHVDVNIHLDGVIHAPTLYFDGRKILDRGVLIVEN